MSFSKGPSTEAPDALGRAVRVAEVPDAVRRAFADADRVFSAPAVDRLLAPPHPALAAEPLNGDRKR